MAVYTTTQLADAVLAELGVTDASETPDTADRTYVTGRYTALMEELTSHGNELSYWTTDDDIPGPVFMILVDMLMLECAGAFGQRIGPAEKEAQKMVIMRRLRRHTAMQSSKRPVQATFY